MLSSTSRHVLSVMALASGIAVGGQIAAASELTFWSMWNEPEPQAQALRTIMANYTKAHPGTTFKVTWNGRQNQTKLRGALQAGTAVDFMDQDGDQLAGGFQKQGQAYQLDDALGGGIKDELLPGAYDIYAEKGKHFQLPYIYNTVNFWYNKDLMEKASGQPPKTWSELMSLCAAVKKTGKHALVVEGTDISYALLYFSHLLEREKGPGAVLATVEDKTGNGWADPAVMDVAKKELALWDEGCFASEARGFQMPAGQQTLALGDSMADLNGSWLPTELNSTTGDDFRWGAFNFPAVEGGKGKSTELQVALLSMLVLKNAPHPQEAVDFLKYVVSADAQKVLVEQGGVGVTRKGIQWPAVLTDASAAASNATSLLNVYGGVGISYADFYTRILGPVHDSMFLGQITPETFVQRMTTETKAYWQNK